MKKRLKINGFIIFITILAISLFPTLFFRETSLDFLNEFYELMGISIMLLGQLVRISARGYKKEHSPKGSALIINGPYKFVRNPMYLGILLIGVGAVLIFFKLWVTGVFFLFFIIRYILLIFQEEKYLLDSFGQAYKDYMLHTPRLFPSLRTLIINDVRDILPLKVAWIRTEQPQVLIVLFVAIFFESGMDIYKEGLKGHLSELGGTIIIFTFFIFLILYLLNKEKALKSGV
ncbi:MAG: isoprenylcysteine carboxylmethyltransferase family protein [Candidatus Omnitrophota bacterium]|nr:isoprenylcysteine carboxylmethyltransferase family protein [Candidatus Omnitrophota bacterium]